MSPETERLLEELHNLFDRIGTPSDNPRRHYCRVAETCAALVHAESCSIWMWDRATDILFLAGEHGYPQTPKISHRTPDKVKEFCYEPAHKGVTRWVFDKNQQSRAKSIEDVQRNQMHEGTIYARLWGVSTFEDHPCHSWYQFPVGSILIKETKKPIAVMKVENKLGNDQHPVKTGGFTDQDEKILELLANSAVPTIYLLAELDAMSKRSIGAGSLANLLYTPDIDTIFSKDVLESISGLRQPRDRELHDCIEKFIKHVEREKGHIWCEYLELAKQHIEEIADNLSCEADLVEYLKPLSDYQAILFRLPGYREHFIHQFNVFLIGYLILNSISDDHFDFFKRCIKRHAVKDDKEVSEKDVFQAWFLTSMMHDTGYPLGSAGEWAKSLMSTMFELGNEELGQSPLNVTEPLAARLLREGAFDWLRFLTDRLQCIFPLDEDHFHDLKKCILNHFVGDLDDDIVAALLLIRAGKDTGLRDSIIAASATAIAAHNAELWPILNRVYFETHPFAFLLYYCDCVQEYGRQRNEETEETAEDWRVKETLIKADPHAVESILNYSKMPKNWKSQIFPRIKKGEAVFLGPIGLKFSIEYQCRGVPKDKIEFTKATP